MTNDSSNRYVAKSLERMVEDPRDDLERTYASEEDQAKAQAIWQKLDKAPNQRNRIIALLAKEAVKSLPTRNEIDGGGQ